MITNYTKPISRILMPLLFVLLSTLGVKAQLAPTYNLGITSGTYSSISGTGASQSAIVGDDAGVNITTLSPGFVVNGVTYTKARMCSNGWVALYTTAPTSTTGYTPLSTAIANGAVIFAPFAVDQNSSTGTGAYTQTIGGVHIFEWKNYTRYNGGNDVLNYQLRLLMKVSHVNQS